MNLLKKVSAWALLLIILCSLSLFFYRGGMKQFPRAIHAWAQSDRYALALNFQQNHFNFFLPETYCLNPQFPAEVTPDREQGITRVDFPIHEYVIALIMQVTGSQSPFIFRFYTLLWGLIGLFFLFQVTRKFTNSILTACFVVVFAFTAPVYTYYQNGFLPSVPALAALLGGYFFYLRYRQNRKVTVWCLSIALFTLAALTRLPFTIFLIALSAQTILYFILEKKWSWKLMLAPAAGFSMIAAYFLYNYSLGIRYGSVFLSNVMPPTSFSEAREIFSVIRSTWLYEYLTGWHYIFLGLITITALIITITRNKVAGLIRGGWLHFGIAAVGVVLYFYLMMRQFIVHDYYFLDTFFPLILLGLVLLCAALPVNHKSYRSVSLIVFLIFASLFVFRAEKIQVLRYTTGSENPVDESIRDYTGAADFLDQAGVPKNARMLVLNSYTPNIPLILMDRKGYAVFGAEAGEVLPFINKRWDYAVVQENMPVLDLLDKDSLFYLHLKRLASNGYIAVYQRCPPKNGTSMMDFLGLDKQHMLWSDSLTFDPDSINQDKPYWPAIRKEAGTGQMLLDIAAEAEYTELLNATSESLHSTHATRLFVSGSIKADSITADRWPELVLAVNNASETSVYYAFRIASYRKPVSGGWNEFAFQYGIPKQLMASDIIKLYWWNTQKGHYIVDNVEIILAD